MEHTKYIKPSIRTGLKGNLYEYLFDDDLDLSTYGAYENLSVDDL